MYGLKCGFMNIGLMSQMELIWFLLQMYLLILRKDSQK